MEMSDVILARYFGLPQEIPVAERSASSSRRAALPGAGGSRPFLCHQAEGLGTRSEAKVPVPSVCPVPYYLLQDGRAGSLLELWAVQQEASLARGAWLGRKPRDQTAVLLSMLPRVTMVANSRSTGRSGSAYWLSVVLSKLPSQ
jgi:hypothetical protein